MIQRMARDGRAAGVHRRERRYRYRPHGLKMAVPSIGEGVGEDPQPHPAGPAVVEVEPEHAVPQRIVGDVASRCNIGLGICRTSHRRCSAT